MFGSIARRPGKERKDGHPRSGTEVKNTKAGTLAFFLPDCSHCGGECFRCRFKAHLGGGNQNVRSMLKSVALLCLVLTLGSALAFAAHHHSNASESAKCTVCVAAHSAAPKASTNLLKTPFSPVIILQTEPVSSRQYFVAFALSVRPPPQA